MSAASSPQANPVTPLLCWDSSWLPRWTVSAHILAGQTACAELHTSPGMRCLSLRHRICHDTDFLALMHHFATLCIPRVSFTAISVLPRCIIYCITAASNCVQHCVCALPWDSHLPWNPHLCCHRLFCGVWPWPQPDAGRCRTPRAALSPRKGGMMEWYPILLQCWLPFLFRSQFRIALHGFVLGYLMGRVSLY